MADEPTVADTVRRAAKLLRERAQKATPGPWHIGNAVDPTTTCNVHAFPSARGVADTVAWLDAEFIATVHPAVALLIADSWEQQAHDMADLEAYETDAGGVLRQVVRTEDRGTHHDWTAVLAAARAVLGETEGGA